ncbi:MAG: hypothetical protein IJT83_09800 [Victivallales bacterium]|nr:hypothetical protein [Victivallales bacterium]
MPDIQISNLDALSAMDLVSKLHNVGEKNLKNEGSIRIGSQTYKVSYVKGDDGVEKLQMRRHYTGFLIGPFLNWCKQSTLTTQPTALALNAKIGELMKSKDYQIASNTYDTLMNIAQKTKGDANGVIEVANYGHSEPRKRITNLSVVTVVNQELAKSGKSIHLNMIDTYNTILDITPKTMQPHCYGALMNKIASGSLKPSEKLLESKNVTVERQDVEQWRAYISDQKILDKIDIPRKLFKYLNQPQESSDDSGLMGWKKDFKLNPDRALRDFVIKNLSPKVVQEAGANDETIDMLCAKLKEYVAIYNMEDGAEKKAKMEEFLKFENWPCTNEDKARINGLINDSINEVAKEKNMPVDNARRTYGKKIKERAYQGSPSRALLNLSSYNLFTNVLMYATFRQTSKIGLDFFKGQGKPILFHTSHRDLTDFGDTGWILNENHWKTGQLDQNNIGSEITHSEVRHANKLIQEYGDNVNGANLWFVRGAQ